MLRILEERNILKHREVGPRYVYAPTMPREKASRSALQRVVQTFFGGSIADAVAAFVDADNGKLPPEELNRIEAIIRNAKGK